VAVDVGEVETGGPGGEVGVAAAGEDAAEVAPRTGVEAGSTRLTAITASTGASRRE
jgi:hypothetical protein